MRRPRPKAGGKWLFVPEHVEKDSPEVAAMLEEEKRNEVLQGVAFRHWVGGSEQNPFAAVDEFYDYFPGENKIPDGGEWLMVKHPPFTEYTVPPFSFWFAEPWPHKNERHCSHRVKIITPKGELGLYPREYSIIKDIAKYYEFLGSGMEIRFFGNEEGVPKDKLFYLRSRGIAKKDAIALLIGSIKAHGVCWIETAREIAETFCREKDFPATERLATV